jgi:hypothetical protein
MDLADLPPALRERIKLRNRKADEAAQLFRKQPGYSRIRIRLAGQVQRFAAIAQLQFGSAARGREVVKWFNAQARAFLPLVTNADLLKAYEDFLTFRRDLAWHEFTGHPPELLPAVGTSMVAFEEKLHGREQAWASKARERIALQHDEKAKPAPPAEESERERGGGRESSRKAVVEPILGKKGWSILDWASHAYVDYHTANDYLKGKTKPYSSTRKKLAECLGLQPEELPQ